MIDILYEDKNLVVCIKPAKISSQDQGENSMVSLLRAQLNSDIFPVHRLDQVVSGCMVYGKNQAAASKLSSFTSAQFSKQYLAVCEGILEEKQAELNDLLFHDKGKNKTYVVDRKRANVKEAKLSYKVLDEKEGKSLLLIQLYTGRTHQIRCQFASRVHPLVGDGKYGSKDNKCLCALVSYRLSFTHPFKKQTLTFTHLPDDCYPFNLFDIAALLENSSINK